jgi:menaquinone-dependent protoporphyrinogen oxidase
MEQSKNLGGSDMSQKILVAYASRTGSTRGVAEAIGKTLTEGGAQVEVLPMQEVTGLSSYSAVVAGSAIQNKGWLPEAMQFIKAHQAELARVPFAAFLVCMTLAMRNGESYRPFVSEFLAPVRMLVKPVNEGLFAGALDISKVPSFGNKLKFRLSVLFGVWSEGDHRDWEAIHAWARGLHPQLLQKSSQSVQKGQQA